MKRFLCFCFLLFSLQSSAQYHGGNDDGFGKINVLTQNALNNIYKGGVNDGVSQSTSLAQNSLNGIYKGGNNDGYAPALALSQNSTNAIYHGGNDDGYAQIVALSQNSSPGIYKGGVDDGFGKILALSQNATNNIYKGGNNDGHAILLALAQNALNGIYKGGNNDGFASITVLHKNPSTVLALTLLAFSGEWRGDDAVLNWRTVDEYHLDHFELERSIDGGKYFEKVGITPAEGGTMAKDYQYADINAGTLPAEVWLYRLKSVQTDGKFTYSGIVRLTKKPGSAVLVLYPNPTSGEFVLQIKGLDNVNGYSYTLHSTTGAVLKKGDITEATTRFNISGYASATYVLTVVKNNELVQHFTIILTQ